MICFPFVGFQEEVEYISKRKKGDIFLHFVNIYKNPKDMKGVSSIADKSNQWLFGNPNNVKNIRTPRKEKLYDYMYYAQVFLSDYPINLMNNKVKSLVGHVYNLLNVSNNLKHSKIIYNKKDLKNIYFKCLRRLDKNDI